MNDFTSFSDKHELARHAAALWLERLAKRDPNKPFTVALSGGRIPKLLYHAVAELAEPSEFENVHFFWGDDLGGNRISEETRNGREANCNGCRK